MLEQFHIFELQVQHNHMMLKGIFCYILLLIVVCMEYFELNEVHIC